jgi:hypothetical protein
MKSANGAAVTLLGVALSTFVTGAGFVLGLLRPPLGEESLFYAVGGIASLGGIILATSRKGPQRVWLRYAWPASAVVLVVMYDLLLNLVPTPSLALFCVEIALFSIATFEIFVLCVWAARGLAGVSNRTGPRKKRANHTPTPTRKPPKSLADPISNETSDQEQEKG